MAREAINTTQRVRVWVGDLEVSAGVLASSIQAPNPLETSIITATGSLTLAQGALPFDVFDIDRSIFPVGSPVFVAVELPNGNLVRHPQGMLYVLGSEVSIVDRTLTLDVGCSLALIGTDENRYRSQIQSLYALADAAVRDVVEIQNYSLAELNSLLTASGLVIVQNQWGTIWSLPLLDAIHDPEQPVAMTCSDTRTSLAADVLGGGASRLPARVVCKATATYPDPATPNGYVCCSPEDDRDAEGSMSPGGSYSETNWERLTVWENVPISYQQITHTGKEAPEEAKDAGMVATGISLAGPNPGDLTSSPTEQEMVWAYYIETPEIISADRQITYQIETRTAKRYDSLGLLVSETVTTKDRVLNGMSGYFGTVLDLYDQERQKLVDEANALYASNNDLLTQRDAYQAFNDPNWFYLEGAALLARTEALAKAAAAEVVFAWYLTLYNQNLVRVATTQKVETTSTYGSGGELTSKIVRTYLPELLSPSNIAEVKTWSGWPYQTIPGTNQERLVLVKTEKWTYGYSGDLVIERYTLTDLWDPLNNVTTVAGSSNSSTAPGVAEQVYSTAPPAASLEAPSSSPLPGDESSVDPYAPVEESPCQSETVTVDLEAVAPVGRSLTEAAQIGWLEADASYDMETGYPLPFKELKPLLIGDECFPQADPSPVLVPLMQAHADRLALAVAAVSNGHVVTEAMRPELFNWRPLMRVHLLLESIGRSVVCVTGAVTWGLKADEAVVAMELYPIGTYAGPIPGGGTPLATGAPAAQEEPIASGDPFHGPSPAFVFTGYGSLASGPAPAALGLVDDEGDPVALPDLRAGAWLAWQTPAATITTAPRPFCQIEATVRAAYSWFYGGFDSDVSGLSLHLGSFADPYPTDYDFGGFAEDTAPAALP